MTLFSKYALYYLIKINIHRNGNGWCRGIGRSGRRGARGLGRARCACRERVRIVGVVAFVFNRILGLAASPF